MPQRVDPVELARNPPATDRYVGIVLEIPEPFRARLQEIRMTAGDPLAHVSKPHITLVPPTEVSQEEAAALPDHLAQVASAHCEFEVVLSGVESFRPVSPVVFAALRSGGEDCSSLEAAVRCGPLDVQTPFEYHPHVTLVQGLSDEVLDRTMASHQHLQMQFPIRSFGHYTWSGRSWQLQSRYHLPARW